MDKSLFLEIAKGGILAVALYILWGAYSEQNTRTNLRVDRLEAKIDDCQGSQRNELTNRLNENTEVLIENNRILSELKNKR
jgi:hypothetical protein